MLTIEKLEKDVLYKQENCVTKEDEDEIKRLKNMISAYESRLIKRASAEENEKKVAIRDQQIIVIKNILQEELSEDDNDRVM